MDQLEQIDFAAGTDESRKDHGSLDFLWSRIAPTGFFIMEDIHTSFPAYSGQYKGSSDITGYDYLQKLQRWVMGSKYMRLPEGGEEPHYDRFIVNYWSAVEAMRWFQGACLIRKKGFAP